LLANPDRGELIIGRKSAVARLGIIISGTIFQQTDIFHVLKEEKNVETEFGNAQLLVSDRTIYLLRHGNDPRHYILPHLINYQANLKALKDIGVSEVIAVNSTGSLKKTLKPGTLMVPHDFIMLSGGLSIFSNKAVHVTPSLDENIRQKWLKAARQCGVEVVDGGIYWQTTGPRLETVAEIGLMSQFADVVGMTMASEAIIAKELELPYAALCSIDNYGHGLVKKPLTMEQIMRQAHKNTEAVLQIMMTYIERS
jgi:5'-methylthioadenosine phosphorylase